MTGGSGKTYAHMYLDCTMREYDHWNLDKSRIYLQDMRHGKQGRWGYNAVIASHGGRGGGSRSA